MAIEEFNCKEIGQELDRWKEKQVKGFLFILLKTVKILAPWQAYGNGLVESENLVTGPWEQKLLA